MACSTLGRNIDLHIHCDLLFLLIVSVCCKTSVDQSRSVTLLNL